MEWRRDGVFKEGKEEWRVLVSIFSADTSSKKDFSFGDPSTQVDDEMLDMCSESER
jgi:hypothetical protein